MQKSCSWNFRKINAEGKASIACEWTLRCTSSIHPKNKLWSNHLLRMYRSKQASKKLTTRTLIFHDRQRPQLEKSLLTTKSRRIRFNFLQIAWIRRSSIVSDGRSKRLVGWAKTRGLKRRKHFFTITLVQVSCSKVKWRRVLSVFDRLSEWCEKKKTSSLKGDLTHRYYGFQINQIIAISVNWIKITKKVS